MPDIIAAADQTAATKLLHDAETTLGTLSKSGGGSLGPFFANYGASVSFSGGTVNLLPPNVIEIANMNVNYSLNLTFGLDLNNFLPHFCLPQICFFGWCTPKICLSWPTVSIPVSFSDSLTITGDFTVVAALLGANWQVNVVINGVPLLQFGAGTALLLAAIGIAGLTGLLGAIITPFISGLSFTVYSQPKLFPVLPNAGVNDPEVDVTITALAAAVQATDKNELVLTASVAA